MTTAQLSKTTIRLSLLKGQNLVEHFKQVLSNKLYLFSFNDPDSDLVTVEGLNQTLIVAVSGLVRDPAGLLWVVGLRLQLFLQLRRDDQPRTRI